MYCMASEKPLVRVVTATRLSESEFYKSCPLGQSLRKLSQDKRICSAAAFQNTSGLSEVFNRALMLSGDNEPDILVFCHDDVRINDHFLVDHLLKGLGCYDVIGVAGGRAAKVNQLSWIGFTDPELSYPPTFLTDPALMHGAVARLDSNNEVLVDYFGAVPAHCDLLDGLFFAVRRSKLVENNIMFDQRFMFHFYDLDFCRQAQSKGLSLGVWPISVTHENKTDGYRSIDWYESAQIYLKKWAE